MGPESDQSRYSDKSSKIRDHELLFLCKIGIFIIKKKMNFKKLNRNQKENKREKVKYFQKEGNWKQNFLYLAIIFWSGHYRTHWSLKLSFSQKKFNSNEEDLRSALEALKNCFFLTTVILHFTLPVVWGLNFSEFFRHKSRNPQIFVREKLWKNAQKNLSFKEILDWDLYFQNKTLRRWSWLKNIEFRVVDSENP